MIGYLRGWNLFKFCKLDVILISNYGRRRRDKKRDFSKKECFYGKLEKGNY